MANYDYIVIGSGSSGSIVAGKLALEYRASVLLLEAGGLATNYPQIEDPNQINCLYGIDAIHWGYVSTPQPYLYSRTMPVWRAKITGGCTAHNDMVYTRGAPADFDQWESEYGCTGWNYANVSRHFQSVEGVLQPTTTTRNAFGNSFVGACNGLGIPFNPNYNSGANMFGVSPLQSTIDRQHRRVTSYDRYVAQPLQHLPGPPNPTVVVNALVDKVEFSGTRATGVTYRVGGGQFTDNATHEVILSAGSINSPQILMRSGIGNAEVIRRLGGKVVADLPSVGQNMWDAIIFLATWSTSRPITDQPVNEGYAIVWADLNAAGQASTCIEMMRGHYICNEEKPQDYYSVSGGAMRLQSLGNLTFASLDPAVAPIIDMRFLMAEGDYNECRQAFELMRNIGNSPGLGSWRSKELNPGPDVSTEAQIREWILKNAWSYSHPVGTCKMGVGNDAVVDPQLRVHGVSNLRVIDASIMPRITSGHTQGPALMIGEKGASMIMGKD